ncbi:MAG: hypothetical protein ACE5FV_08735 [Woeseia sp.]
MNRVLVTNLWLAAVLLATSCQSGSDDVAGGGSESAGATTAAAVGDKPKASADAARASGGKPSAPIRIDYEIMGTPLVGIPLSINVKVSSSMEREITVNYRIIDSTSLMFSDAQAETVSVIPVGDDSFSSEQVTVIPQREGRLFLNVSAEIETDIGRMAKAMAIPIQVGSQRPVPQLNGELTTGEDGEALISMPAKED